MDPAVTSLCLNITAAGITAGTGVATSNVHDILRRKKYDDNLEHVATVFAESLEAALEAENARRDTKELAGATDDWEAVLAEVSSLVDADGHDRQARERDQVGHLFRNEADAAVEIAEAIATVQGFDLSKTPQLREDLIAAVGDAYGEAVADFERRIAGSDLGEVFQQELQLDIREAVDDLQTRLEQLEGDIDLLLTQDARNEGFRQLTPTFFARGTPTPETSWRTTFTLADVHADIPARRDGHDDQYADDELLAALRDGENRLVVGCVGAGKSTLCKQVAVSWYERTDTGPVLYRDSDTAGAAFESRDALRETIDRADGHVLVVVEDATRAGANAIFRMIEEYESNPDVTFLLDARETELDREPDAQTLDRSSDRRYRDIAGAITRYELPAISEADIARTIDAFEAATGRTVERSASELYEEIQSESGEGFGAFLLLAFHLPFGDGAVRRDRSDTSSGLEAHVRSRYRTVMEPGSDGALRDLSQFDPDLLADVGVMVNLLNASGIGIYPELVHSLGHEYGTDIDTHDEIHEIREALSGWFLYDTGEEGGEMRTTHELWSTLYLRALARDHQEQQASSRRRERSEPRTARCLSALFALFDDEDHRAALEEEFPGSSVLAAIGDDTEAKADEYVKSIFQMIEEWPILAVLAGKTETARYELPAACSAATRLTATIVRGNAHLKRGEYKKAQEEFEESYNGAKDSDNSEIEIKSLGSLGLVAEKLGEYDDAQEYIQQSLSICRDIGDRHGEAKNLHNLGDVARDMSEYEDAREYFQQSLAIYRDIDDRRGEADNLISLGNVAQDLGEYEDAREYYQQSLAIHRDVDDRLGIASNLDNLGLVASSVGEYEDAKEYHQQSLSISRDIGDRQGEANSLNNLGLLAMRLGEYGDVQEYFRQSLSICRDIGDRDGEANRLNNLGYLAQNLDEYEDAQEHYQESLAMKRTIDDRLGEATTLRNLGLLAKELGDYDEARNHLQQSLSILRKLEHPSADRLQSELEQLPEEE